jgi:hypothetical protein
MSFAKAPRKNFAGAATNLGNRVARLDLGGAVAPEDRSKERSSLKLIVM